MIEMRSLPAKRSLQGAPRVGGNFGRGCYGTGIVSGAKRDGESLSSSGGRGDRGIPFCKRCAHDQEAYFAIGELTQALTSDRACQVQSFHRGEQLFETLRRMRRDRADHTVEDKTERAASVASLG
jgi:hypothetical protein